MLIRFIIAACLIGFGVFLFAMSTFGVFKFKYVLNRMHASAIHLHCSHFLPVLAL